MNDDQQLDHDLGKSSDGRLCRMESCAFPFFTKDDEKHMSEMEEHRNPSLDSREYRNVVT